MRRLLTFGSWIGTACMLFVSCNSVHDEQITAENQMIAQHIAGLTSNGNIINTVYKNGVSRCLIFKGDTLTPILAGDSVYFNFAAYAMTSNAGIILYETNVKEIAKEGNLDTTLRRFEPKAEIAGVGKFIDGLDRGLTMCYLYEQSFLIFDSDLGYGSTPIGIVPAYSPLIYQVQITKVVKN